MKPPKIENAPGLVWRPSRHGWQARWRARADLVARGYQPRNVTIWTSTADAPEPSPAAQAIIQEKCSSLQGSMLVWGKGGFPAEVKFDGSVKSLARCYQTDADSPYRKTRYKTRLYYDRLIKRIVEGQDGAGAHGDEQLCTLKARTFLRWHEDWSADGHVSIAHALIGMVRTLIRFGKVFLEDEECERLAGALSDMTFPQGKARSSILTAEQATAIRAEAHRRGYPSLALGQALQFELMLRQKDVIGEWVPASEPGVSEVTRGNEKWLRGLRWNEIDKDLTLRHVTSKRQKEIEVNLCGAQMVMEELEKIGTLPSSGPMVIYERTGLPWDDSEYRRRWRVMAKACGVPSNVRNMDSRAGAITEATIAGAPLEHVQHAATHSDIAMTQRYSRGDKEKTAGVLLKRVEHRNKKAT